jgi:hypothetical protein
MHDMAIHMCVYEMCVYVYVYVCTGMCVCVCVYEMCVYVCVSVCV